MFPRREPLKVLLTNLADQPPPICELSVPHAANHVAFAVIVLARVLEFLFVIAPGLAPAQRLGKRGHGLPLLEEWLLSHRRDGGRSLAIAVSGTGDWMTGVGGFA